MPSHHSHHRHQKHSNVLFLFIGILLAVLLYTSPHFTSVITRLGTLGGLIGGLLFTSTFTFPTGSIILITLTKTISPIVLILVAALGAVTTDTLMFRFAQKEIVKEIAPVYQKIIGSHFRKILHTRYFSWTLPVIGALIIASPLPDELGISLLGISQMKLNRFILISFFFHLIGISAIIIPSYLSF